LNFSRWLGFGALLAGGALCQVRGAAPSGKGEILVGEKGREIRVFTYKPATFSNGPIFFVFHGMKRNAADYRDSAVPLADRHGAMVAAPFFDTNRFSSHLYPRGGIFRKDGSLRPQEDWSVTWATRILREVLEGEGDPRREHYLIGHSAGAQFLSRYVALEPVTARRVVAANAGTYAFPRTDWDWAYGLGKLPKSFEGEETLRRYLGAPLTVCLGKADTNNTAEAGNFDASAEANREGLHRLERGRNFFEFGRKLAEEKKWSFGWIKVEIPEVGHDGELMLKDLRMDQALEIKNKVP